jgi:hypothetical protein
VTFAAGKKLGPYDREARRFHGSLILTSVRCTTSAVALVTNWTAGLEKH